MSDEIKETKSHLVLDKDDPKSKAKASFERQDQDMTTERNQKSKNFLIQGGHLHEESPWKYAGSFACHIYVHNMGRMDYQFVTQTVLGDIPEPISLHGWKELQAKLMSHYGQKVPKELM